MIARALFVLAAAAASVAARPQRPFPHEMGPPGVKIDYLGEAHLPKNDKDAIVAIVFKDSHVEECLSPGRSLLEEIDTIRVARVVLGAAAPAELLVQASDNCHCGATGNCWFWVLQREGKGFRVLLETDMVHLFSVETSRKNGYRDILTSSHGSAFYSDLVLYRFDGAQYRATDCGSVDYEGEDGGMAKRPRLARTECPAKIAAAPIYKFTTTAAPLLLTGSSSPKMSQ